MGKRYEQHSDLCGCERCAKQADCENPQPVYDCIEDPDIMDCGCPWYRGCDCDYYPDDPEDDTTDEPMYSESLFHSGNHADDFTCERDCAPLRRADDNEMARRRAEGNEED